MEVIQIGNPLVGLNSEPLQRSVPRQKTNLLARVLQAQRRCVALRMKNNVQLASTSSSRKVCIAFCSSSTEVENLTKSTTKFKDFEVLVEVGQSKQINIKVYVSGARTQENFDEVFTKLVDAAQPIPGFRRVKGGKTPGIPKDVLLQIIGPSKVNKEAIMKVINSTIAEYVEKEGLDVSHDLRVLQNYEELEAAFMPGKEFSFEVTIKLNENRKIRK
ncbi:hypothetical protein HPP92_001250 [Vanilla planifolia]|uniref:peptidylprolyl isomerase n=1 Tax=Vanilla planifolia TaxID=51239 RepID=A0A835RVX3_VANPL|nr:hypothetical protein HPP92_001250 [Vanilla planifolia]